MDVEGGGGRDQGRNGSKSSEGDRGTTHLRGAQSGVDPELGRALSPWRTDRVWLCTIGRESGREQTNGEAPTDAVDTPRVPPALQIRTRVLNEEWEDTFRRWYRGLCPQTQEKPDKKAPNPRNRMLSYLDPA